MNADDENRKAQESDESKQFGGRTLSREEIIALANQYPSSTPKFPDSNGSEIACLAEDGTIEILHTTNTSETSSHGTQSITPANTDYEYYWKRHGFDDPKGKNHAILKKWTGEKWIDLGDHWY
ncbi:hypothetical protein BH10CYA1_BH10CYA1_60060 [soil metagenome]